MIMKLRNKITVLLYRLAQGVSGTLSCAKKGIMLWLRTKCPVYRQICLGLTAKQIFSGDGSLGTVPICLPTDMKV